MLHHGWDSPPGYGSPPAERGHDRGMSTRLFGRRTIENTGPILGSTAARCVACPVLLSLVLVPGCSRAEPDAAERFAVAFPVRALQPRLSFPQEHAPCRPSRAVCRTRSGEPGLTLLSELWGTLSTIDDPAEHAWATGLWHLLGADDPASLNEAVGRLETAARQATGARVYSDLSAAYLVRGVRTSAPLDVRRSLEAAIRAAELDPGLAPALHNLGVAAAELGLLRVARAAFLDAASFAAGGWRAEAESRAADLADLVAATETPQITLGDSSSEDPQRIREDALDRRLARWGEHQRTGDRSAAEQELSMARRAGATLAGRGGDRSVADAVAAIDGAAAADDDDRLGLLARGHAAYGRVREYIRESAYDRATEDALLARESFARAGSPMVRWARLMETILTIYRGELTEARQRAALELASADPDRYPSHAGMLHWAIGLSHVRSGRAEAATLEYRRMADLFEFAGERENRAAAYMLLADAAAVNGQVPLADRQMDRALGLLSRLGRPTLWLHSALLIESQRATRRGLPRLGLALLREDEAVAAALDSALFPTENRMYRVQPLAGLGRWDEALASVREARSLHLDIKDRLLRERLGAEITLAEVEVDSTLADDDRLAMLMAAETGVRASGLEFLLPELLVRRARLHLGGGNPDAGAADAVAAVRLVEKWAADARDPAWRDALVTVGSDPFELLIALELSRGDPAAALAWAERARAASLREAAVRRPDEIRVAIDARVAGMRSDEAVIEIGVLDDRTVLWLVTEEGLSVDVVAMDEAAVAAEVERVRSAVESNAGLDALRRASEKLSRAFVSTMQRVGDGVSRLTVVPDGPFHAMPFALLAGSGGGFLIERFELQLATSLATPAERSPAGSTLRRALLVADPAFRSEAYPGLGRLPHALAEVDLVAAHHTDPVVLRGAEATDAAVTARLESVDEFHYAGHALFTSASEGESRLLLAPASTDSVGTVPASAIRDLDLSGLRLVVLSACQTLSPEPTRSGGVAGLAQSFLRAGARNVVATLWPVADAGASDLIGSFYSNRSTGADDVSALTGAQRLALRRSEPARTWAGFVIVAR